MVKPANRNGLIDWVVQRCTALLIGIYAVFLFVYLLDHATPTYSMWQELFSSTWMRVATVIVLISILWHAWIGLWTVFTDYVKVQSVRILLQVIVILLLLAYFIWVLESLWR